MKPRMRPSLPERGLEVALMDFLNPRKPTGTSISPDHEKRLRVGGPSMILKILLALAIPLVLSPFRIPRVLSSLDQAVSAYAPARFANDSLRIEPAFSQREQNSKVQRTVFIGTLLDSDGHTMA